MMAVKEIEVQLKNVGYEKNNKLLKKK